MSEAAEHFTRREHELTTIRELTDYLGVNEAVRVQADRIWEIIRPKLDSIIEAFYSRIRCTPTGVALDLAAIARLKVSQHEHWQQLFSSRFDSSYLRSATKVGIRHRSIGLDPKWYVAGYTTIKIAFIQQIMRTPMSLTDKARLIETLDKYIAIDMGMALSTYSAAIVD